MTTFENVGFKLLEQKEEANHLAIILPGAGYSTQAPLLHYATRIFYEKGYDVLHINYTFTREELSALNEQDFARDVQIAINNAVKDKKYSYYYVVAKSIGTKAVRYLLDHIRLKEAKVVWLTPILQNDDVFHAMLTSEHKGLCIFGEKDSCFIVERFEKLKSNLNLTLIVIEGGNHSLELDGQPFQSIEKLKSVITELNEF